MNIMGLGDTLVEALVSEGYLRSYADIYHLFEHRDVLIEKGIIGKEKNTDKLLGEIEKSKENDPVRLAIFGNNTFSREMFKAIFSCGQMYGHDLEISVIYRPQNGQLSFREYLDKVSPEILESCTEYSDCLRIFPASSHSAKSFFSSAATSSFRERM